MRRLLLLVVAVQLALTHPAPAAEKKKAAGSVRVYRFDDLDIEGHVKTPQIMVFFKRIKKRFQSFRLPRQHFSRRIIENKNAPFLR